jgi:hypothetical protein
MTLSEAQARRHPGSGLPLLTRITFSACCAHYPGGSVRASRLSLWRAPAPGSSPTALAVPYTTDGRHPRYSFRGLLELHWCYGLQICSPTFVGLVARLRWNPLPGSIACQLSRHTENSWRGTFTHWCFARKGARCVASTVTGRGLVRWSHEEMPASTVPKAPVRTGDHRHPRQVVLAIPTQFT